MSPSGTAARATLSAFRHERAAVAFLAGIRAMTDPGDPELERSSSPFPELEEDAAACRSSLGRFLRGGWHVVEPTTERIDGWSVDALVEHLEALWRGEIRNLLVNVPPGTQKSLTVSVFLPAWSWTDDPSSRWLTASYAAALATRDALRSRRLIQSAWYRQRWGHRFELTTDQNIKSRYENDRTGYRLATSVGGTGIGEKADVVTVDDPHNLSEAESATKREAALVWWDEVISTRLNDPATGRKVIVMQRLHDRDLSGHVLAQGGYEHLMLPMEYDPKRRCSTSIGFEDPRTEEGELLWPERYPADVVADLELRLGPHATATQLQQRTSSRKGSLIDRAWLAAEIIEPENVPAGLTWIRAWDKAGTSGGGKYSAGVLMGRGRNGTGRDVVVVRDVVRGQWGAVEREEQIDATAELDAAILGGRTSFTIWGEQEPGSGGKESAEATALRLSLAGFTARFAPATGDKLSRAGPFAGACKAGVVKIVRGPWTEPYLAELGAAGPGAEFLDQLDASSLAFNKLLLGRTLPPGDIGISFGPVGRNGATRL